MEKITVLCYPKCSTCKKAEDWLKGNGIQYEYRHIKENNPTAPELKEWIEKSNLPIRKFFNTSGLLYKEHNMKEKVNTLSQEELIGILASDGMMVKRPLVLLNDQVLLGFKEADWKVAFNK